MEPHFQTLVCLSPLSFLLLSLTQFPLLCNVGVVPPFKVVLRLLFRASRGVSWGQAQGLQPQPGPMHLLSVNRPHPMLNLPPQLGKVWKVPGPQSLDFTRLSFFPPGTGPQTACPAFILDET